MGFGFNFKDYNDRLTFKNQLLRKLNKHWTNKIFKAEIAKEKKQKLKNLKKNSSLEEFFLPSGSAGKNSKNFWNLGNEGVLRPPSRSLVKSKITPPNPLVLKDFFLDQKKKKRNWSKTTVCV